MRIPLLAVLVTLLGLAPSPSAAQSTSLDSPPAPAGELCHPPFRCEMRGRLAVAEPGWAPAAVPSGTAALSHTPVPIPLIGLAIGAGATTAWLWYGCRNTECMYPPVFAIFTIAVGAGAGFLGGLLVHAVLHSREPGASAPS